MSIVAVSGPQEAHFRQSLLTIINIIKVRLTAAEIHNTHCILQWPPHTPTNLFRGSKIKQFTIKKKTHLFTIWSRRGFPASRQWSTNSPAKHRSPCSAMADKFDVTLTPQDRGRLGRARTWSAHTHTSGLAAPHAYILLQLPLRAAVRLRTTCYLRVRVHVQHPQLRFNKRYPSRASPTLSSSAAVTLSRRPYT